MTHVPSGVTSFNLFSMFTRGILTCLNASFPLSTPFIPIFHPMSSIWTPAQGFI